MRLIKFNLFISCILFAISSFAADEKESKKRKFDKVEFDWNDIFEEDEELKELYVKKPKLNPVNNNTTTTDLSATNSGIHQRSGLETPIQRLALHTPTTLNTITNIPCFNPTVRRASAFNKFVPANSSHATLFSNNEMKRIDVIEIHENALSEVFPGKVNCKLLIYKEKNIFVIKSSQHSSGIVSVSMALLANKEMDFSLLGNQFEIVNNSQDQQRILQRYNLSVNLVNINPGAAVNVLSSGEIHAISYKKLFNHIQSNLNQYSCAIVNFIDTRGDFTSIILYALEDDGVIVSDPLLGTLFKVSNDVFLSKINTRGEAILWVKK